MSSPLPSLLEQQPCTDTSTLAIEDAWSMALAWRGLLHSSFVLQRSPHDSTDAAKSYAWIHFETNIDSREVVSAARAAAVTWFALSCCPGYGAHENPVFWKCVFSELSQTHIGDMRGRVQLSQSITDAYGFFDGIDRDFPRFRMNAYGDAAKVLLFCGHPSEELESDDKVKLDQVIERLAPWIDHQRTLRRPVVSLVRMYPEPGEARYQEMMWRPSHKPVEWAILRFISDANQSTSAGSEWPSPMFVVEELDVSGDFFHKDSNKMQWISEVLRSHNVAIPSFDCPDSRNFSRDALADIVRSVLCLPGSSALARTTEVRIEDKDPIALAAFASALPLTTSIRAVKSDAGSKRMQEFIDQTAIVWIAYALFHPDTLASSWKSLIIKDAVLRERCVAVLRAMAGGNNLTAMLDGKTPTSDGYYCARLAPNAIVYDGSSRSFIQRLKRAAIVISDGTLEVEVCDVASENPKQWGKWVSVVVPAYGLGRVRSSDVTRVVKRPPAEASLTHLHLSHWNWQDRCAPSLLAGVLFCIGQRLVHLDVGENGDYLPSTDLKQALSLCQSLESLRVTHNGTLWATEEMESVLPRLCELHLQMRIEHGEYAQLAVMHLPRSLQVLRVSAHGYRGVYSLNADAIKHILSQPCSLRVFHWEHGLRASYHPTPYTETCAGTSRRLDELAVAWSPYVDVRLSAACTATFLSVLAQPVARYSAMAQLDQELAKMILAFASTRAARSIVLEPDQHDIPYSRTILSLPS